MAWYLRYQNAIMLRLDSAKNGEEFWVLSQIRKTVGKFDVCLTYIIDINNIEDQLDATITIY